MKTCGKCGETKAANAFAKRSLATGVGLQSWCRLCLLEAQRGWRRKNPEAVKRSEQRARERNPGRRAEIAKAYRARHREKLSGHWRERRRAETLKAYGLTPADYDRILASQNNACAICESTDPQHWSGRFHVDHDHATGQVRGLLCHGCNTGLGSFRDNIGSLQAAVAYVCAAVRKKELA